MPGFAGFQEGVFFFIWALTSDCLFSFMGFLLLWLDFLWDGGVVVRRCLLTLLNLPWFYTKSDPQAYRVYLAVGRLGLATNYRWPTAEMSRPASDSPSGRNRIGTVWGRAC